jgi:hypothetical protein
MWCGGIANAEVKRFRSGGASMFIGEHLLASSNIHGFDNLNNDLETVLHTRDGAELVGSMINLEQIVVR